jgi:homocysteine S-methyltransferase
MRNNQFVIAVELDPPFNADAETILKNARICKSHGVDVITIADSPMGRARVDSVMLAAKIKREVGIEVIPHICCRDKNINALKSAILAGYIENIRNILAVTGDPIATAERNEIKGVFDLNSFKLIELISIMNIETFAGDPINIGGALNLNILKPQDEVSRMMKKSELGASFFLTQPIFDDDVIEFLPQVKKNDNMYILGGIMPLVSYKNAQFLNNEVAGIKIPERILSQFDQNMEKAEAEDLGVEIAVDIANRIKNNVDGFYFITPFNRAEMIIKIMNKLGI